MYRTHFYPRNRNVTGEVLVFPGDRPFSLLVSLFGRTSEGEVERYQPPGRKKNWGGYTPRFECATELPKVRPELYVATMFNLKPTPELLDAHTAGELWPDRIYHWPESIEIVPVVINHLTGEERECPSWFQSTLQKVRAYYDVELMKLMKLVGNNFGRRVAAVDHPLLSAELPTMFG